MTVEIERSVSASHVSYANFLAAETETQTGSARGSASGEDRFVIFDWTPTQGTQWAGTVGSFRLGQRSGSRCGRRPVLGARSRCTSLM